MDLIDRYVFAVTEQLAEDTREDVKKELRANIEDMLPENAAEKDVRTVLEKLGDPAVLANEYRQDKRYLIGPALYDKYLSVLKLVVGIVAVVAAFLTLLGDVFRSSAGTDLLEMSVDVFVNVLSAAFQGATQAFLWVTVVFVILERAGAGEGNLSFGKQKWSIDDLPLLPRTNKGRISRSGTILSMFFIAFLTALLYFQPQLIGWYEKSNNGFTLIVPLFSVERLKSYIFVIILLTIVQFGISTYKIISVWWNTPLAIANTAYNIALGILVCVMLFDKALLNSDVALHFAAATKIPVSQVMTMCQLGTSAFAVLFIIVCAWDSVTGFIKCRK